MNHLKAKSTPWFREKHFLNHAVASNALLVVLPYKSVGKGGGLSYLRLAAVSSLEPDQLHCHAQSLAVALSDTNSTLRDWGTSISFHRSHPPPPL